MKLVFLVNGEDAMDLLADIPFPGSSKHSIGHYGKRDVFVVTVSLDRKTVQSAKILADYRDQLLALEKNKKPKKRSVKCLHDEASEFFCARLYPKFLEFERGLRMAVTIALCADRDSFDSEVAASLEHLTLEKLGERLFTDRSFVEEAQSAVNTNYIRKDVFLRRVEKMQEKAMWNGLFGNDMPSVKRLFDEIRDRRNDVMHFHTMGSTRYQTTVSMLGKANREIRDFISISLANVNYPSKKARDARQALQNLAETYTDMYREWQQTITPLQEMVARNREYYSELLQAIAPYQESMRKIQEMTSEATSKLASSIQYPQFDIPESTIRAAQAMVDAAACAQSVHTIELGPDHDDMKPQNRSTNIGNQSADAAEDQANEPHSGLRDKDCDEGENSGEAQRPEQPL